MGRRLALQADLKSTGSVELVSIGEAARRLGLNASALRYYEERGIVRPATRRSGRRMYGPDELRRLAFVQLFQRLGIALDAAAAVLDEPDGRWRAAVAGQVVALDELIARATDAREVLGHALRCPAEHPVRDCPYMIGALDRRLAGATFEDLAAEHADG
jgi:DNA-binding transcriptional MerR regulator